MTPLAGALICLASAALAQEAIVQVTPAEGPAVAGAAYGTGYAFSSVRTKLKDAVPPVVIQFSTSDRPAVEAMEEDLAVMTRIIEKALDGGLGEEQAMGIPLLVTKGSRSVRALQVEGLGAIFMIKVNFPLLPPPKAEEKKPERATTSEWESAKNEIDGFDIQTEERWSAPAAAGGDYDEEQVEGLKKTLLLALKQATNMKHLKPEDSVVVSVFGSPNGGVASKTKVQAAATPGAKSQKPAAPGVTTEDLNAPVAPAPPAPAAEPKTTRSRTTGAAVQEARVRDELDHLASRASVLKSSLNRRAVGQGTVVTLRVKKSDVDAFAKGALDFDAFQKRATVNAYIGSGQGITSVNSWISIR